MFPLQMVEILSMKDSAQFGRNNGIPTWNYQPFLQLSHLTAMELDKVPLTCNRIANISLTYENSDYVILPAHLKPKKSNMLGSYVFKITSDLSDHWIYCRVAEWKQTERDCYLPTVID